MEDPSPDRLAELVGAGVVPMDNLVLLCSPPSMPATAYSRRPSEGRTRAPLDFSDREHIRVHLDRRTDGLSRRQAGLLGWRLGAVVDSIVTGGARSRMDRCWGRDRGRDGPVVFRAVLGAGEARVWTDRIELIGTDGVVRARNSESTRALIGGLQRPELPVIATNDGGHFRDHDSFDGVERLSLLTSGSIISLSS